MEVPAQGLSLDARRRDMGADTIDREHHESEENAFPELRDIKYVLQAGEQGLNHLGLPASGLYFFKSTFTELMCAHG